MIATRVAGADRRRTGLDLCFGADVAGRRDEDRVPEVTEEGMASGASPEEKP